MPVVPRAAFTQENNRGSLMPQKQPRGCPAGLKPSTAGRGAGGGRGDPAPGEQRPGRATPRPQPPLPSPAAEPLRDKARARPHTCPAEPRRGQVRQPPASRSSVSPRPAAAAAAAAAGGRAGAAGSWWRRALPAARTAAQPDAAAPGDMAGLSPAPPGVPALPRAPPCERRGDGAAGKPCAGRSEGASGQRPPRAAPVPSLRRRSSLPPARGFNGRLAAGGGAAASPPSPSLSPCRRLTSPPAGPGRVRKWLSPKVSRSPSAPRRERRRGARPGGPGTVLGGGQSAQGSGVRRG